MANNTLGMTDKAFELMIEACQDDIWSFAESTPPKGAVEVGRIEKKYGTYIYYMDKDGKLLYNTEEGIEFAKKQEEAQRRLKRKK